MRYPFATSLFSLVASVSTSLAAPQVDPLWPAEPIPLGPPTWCEGVVAKDTTKSQPKLSSEIYGGMKLDGMRALVLYSCAEPGDAAHQAVVQAVRQSISNDYNLTRADNVRLMKLAAKLHGGNERYRALSPERDPGCSQLAPRKDGTLAQRFTRALERVGIGCGDWHQKENREAVPRLFGAESPPYWVADFEGGFGSELAKAMFVADVLTDFTGKRDTSNLRDYRSWVNASGVTLDDAKFREQLAAMKLPEISAVTAIIGFRTALGRFERQRKFIADAAKKTKALAAIFFTGPSAARDQWARDAAANKPTFDAILALEEKLSAKPGGMTGCAKQLFPAFQTWMRGVAKASPSRSVLELAMTDFQGSLLAYGLTVCGLNDADAPVMDQVFGYYFYRSPAHRGPIAASHAGMARAIAANKGSIEVVKPVVNPPSLGMSLHAPFLPYDPTLLSSGIVASVKTAGADTKITFRVETRKVPVLECGETEDVLRYTQNATPIYEYKCKQLGEKSVTGAPSPIAMPSFAAGGIKPGVTILYWQYPNNEGKDRAWPIEVYADKRRKQRVNMLGAQL